MTETFVACCEEGNFRTLKEKQMGGAKSETSEVRMWHDGQGGKGCPMRSADIGKASSV